jgi:hypothetical protein
MAVALAATCLLTGCGDFWQNPNGTGSGGTTASTTTLAASSTTTTVGAAVTLTATVSPSAATGTVTFYDGTTSIGTGTLSSGTATLSTSFTAAGSQSLTATYGGSSTYASSTSVAVTVTVSAATSSSAQMTALTSAATATGAAAASGQTNSTTNNYQAATIRTEGAVNLTGGTYTANNAEAVVVEGSGSVTLSGTALNSASGNDRGVLLYSTSADPSSATTRFTMTGGSITYNCSAASTPACAEGSTTTGQNNPATLFSVANTTANLALTDVTVADNTSTSTNSEGTLLTAEALNSGQWGTAGANGGNAAFLAQGTALTGNVIVDSISTLALSLLEDSAGTGSSLTGAINSANTGKTVNLTLDQGSIWTVTGTSYLSTLNGLEMNGATVNNIDGGGHCVYYSGAVNGSNSAAVYQLSGGGYLAPAGSTGLNCE